MFEKMKTFYKNLSFDTIVTLMLLFGAATIALVLATTISNSAKKDQQLQDFFDKCSTACYPNTVYSIQYKRCSCNAAVVVREVK